MHTWPLQSMLLKNAQEIFVKTGMLDIGATFEKSLESAKLHNLHHEVGGLLVYVQILTICNHL
jgi:hypothetical protein